MKTLFLMPFTAVACLLSSIAVAQTAVGYTSPIADYKPFADEKITSWKAANDKVGQIGGWRAYTKEAQQPENTPTLPSGVSPNSAPLLKPAGSSAEVMKTDPHAGHKK